MESPSPSAVLAHGPLLMRGSSEALPAARIGCCSPTRATRQRGSPNVQPPSSALASLYAPYSQAGRLPALGAFRSSSSSTQPTESTSAQSTAVVDHDDQASEADSNSRGTGVPANLDNDPAALALAEALESVAASTMEQDAPPLPRSQTFGGPGVPVRRSRTAAPAMRAQRSSRLTEGGAFSRPPFLSAGNAHVSNESAQGPPIGLPAKRSETGVHKLLHMCSSGPQAKRVQLPGWRRGATVAVAEEATSPEPPSCGPLLGEGSKTAVKVEKGTACSGPHVARSASGTRRHSVEIMETVGSTRPGPSGGRQKLSPEEEMQEALRSMEAQQRQKQAERPRHRRRSVDGNSRDVAGAGAQGQPLRRRGQEGAPLTRLLSWDSSDSELLSQIVGAKEGAEVQSHKDVPEKVK